MPINIPDTASYWSSWMKAQDDDPDNACRKRDSKIVADYYNNNQTRYLETALQQIYTNKFSLIKKRKWTQNYTKQLVDSIAQCYACKVDRTMGKKISKANKQLLEDVVWHGINTSMDTANKSLIFDKQSLVQTRWTEAKQRISYLNYYQFNYDLAFDPNSDDRELLGVRISDYKRPIGGVHYDEDSISWVYTKNKTYTFKGYKVIDEIVHNLNFLPFSLMYAEDPGFNKYLHPNIQIANSNLELNIANCNLLLMLQNKVHGIPVLTTEAEDVITGINPVEPAGSRMPGSPPLDRSLDINDPSMMLHLTQTRESNVKPSLQIIAQETDFDGAISTIKFLADSFANSFGEDGVIFESKVNTNPATLYKINEQKRQARLKVYQSKFRDFEKELFSKALALSTYARNTMPNIDPNKLVVDYIPEDNVITEINVADLLALYNNPKLVIDRVEIVRKIWPGLNREEALERIKLMEATEEALAPEEETEVDNSVEEEED